jgi:hypothetical protein
MKALLRAVKGLQLSMIDINQEMSCDVNYFVVSKIQFRIILDR